MKTLRAMLVRLAGLFRRKQHEAEMNEELRAHLDALMERNVAAGMSPEEARYAAQRKFGGVAQIQECARDERRSAWGEQCLQDVRYAARQIRKAPGFTAVVVLSLALGIGANTAIFTVVNALLLRSLPVPEPERLVIIRGAENYARFAQLRKEVTSLSGLFAVGHVRARPMIGGASGIAADTESVVVQEVSGNFFSVLGESAQLGRPLVADDDQPHAARPVVVLSHAYWRRRFAGDPTVLGRTIVVSNVAVAIVGVMPPGFFGPDVGTGRSVDLWCPLWLKLLLDDGFEAQRLTGAAEGSFWLEVMGRLQRGASFEQASAELAVISQRDRARHPDNPPPKLTLRSGETGYSRLRGNFRQPINVLWTVAALVLLVACANVGGLLLARGATRQREFAVRLAMGAARGRIARQLITESLLLALLGGAAGLLFASWGVTTLGRYMVGSALDLSIDVRVLAFAITVAAATGLLFGLAPVLRFSRLDLTTAFHSGIGSVGGPDRQRVNRALVVAQIALSFTLVAGAGLFVRTLQNLRAQDPGFGRENVLQFGLDFGRARTDLQRLETYGRVRDEIAALPGVQSATLKQGGLLGSSNTFTGFSIDGVEVALDKRRGLLALLGGRDYFATTGTPLRRGRDFTAQDEQPGAARVAVISETVARQYFPGVDPIGRQILQLPNQLCTIIGVAADAQVRGLREPPEAAIYLLHAQQPDRWDGKTEICLRTEINPIALAPSLRAVVKKIDPRAELTELATVTQLLEQRLWRERAIADLAGFFSGLTLLLAGIGLYGLLAYGVTQRTREIGVRLALGAQVHHVLRVVIGPGVRVVATGCVLGAAAAAALTRFVTGMLYGVAPHDPWALGGAGMLLLAVGLLACWLPARRATKIDPIVALRAE